MISSKFSKTTKCDSSWHKNWYQKKFLETTIMETMLLATNFKLLDALHSWQSIFSSTIVFQHIRSRKRFFLNNNQSPSSALFTKSSKLIPKLSEWPRVSLRVKFQSWGFRLCFLEKTIFFGFLLKSKNLSQKYN